MVAAASISSVHTPIRMLRTGPVVPVRIVENIVGQDLLDASISLAHTQLAGQLADETGIDARTMGTLGFVGALLAVDIAAKDLLGVAWWVVLIALGAAACCCLGTVLGIGVGVARDPDFGPDPSGFYVRYAGARSSVAREQLLTDLVAAFANNASRLHTKRRALRTSLAVLAVGLVTLRVLSNSIHFDKRYPWIPTQPRLTFVHLVSRPESPKFCQRRQTFRT